MDRNTELYERACKLIPGGVNSPVRAFGSVGGTPLFIEKAKGPFIWDANNKQYIDYVGSWGPAILGHAHPKVIKAVQQAASLGLSFGAPTQAEIELAELIKSRVPSIDKLRMVSSGTEATMSAIRLARGYTNRDKIIKFEGCYHGHADSLLVKAGSGLLTFGNPTSAGVPEEFIQHTLVLDFNDLDGVQKAFEQHGKDIACVIIEPIAGNMNLIKPKDGFLEGLRKLCTEHGAVLIFDEVMTGFRAGPQGVQGLTNITPDLTTLAKVIGGGMPVGAFGGRVDIMDSIAPLGAVYQAGTVSGDPVAMAAGIAVLNAVGVDGFYEQLQARTQQLAQGLQERATAAGITLSTDHVGGMLGLYFSENNPTNMADVANSNIEQFKAFFHAMLNEGIYLAPSAFEACFVSSAHNDDVINQTLQAAENAFSAISNQ